MVESYLGLLKILFEQRTKSPVGLSMRQMVCACTADALLKLYYYGEEDAPTRRMLTACGLQDYFEKDLLVIPLVLYNVRGMFRPEKFEGVFPFRAGSIGPIGGRPFA